MTQTQSTAGLCELCESGALWNTVESYIAECRTDGEDASPKRVRRASRFPNLAGLCRYISAGVGELARLCREYPDEYDRLLAIFEDEALNADLSPTLVSGYMKKRIQYSDDASGGTQREVSYCFEHDIYADGE